MATVEYAIQFQDEQAAWVVWYETAEKSDAEEVFRRLLESGPRARVRLLEVEVLRSTEGEAAASERAQGSRRPEGGQG